MHSKPQHDGSESYALATGPAGSPRLDLQDRFLFENSRDFLAKAGLRPGMTVMDIGCGNGVLTSYLAKSVGTTGRVVAVDISGSQIALAEQRIKAENLHNVSFTQADFTVDPLPKGEADLINLRFVLMHLKDPVAAAARLKPLLKSNGVIAVQEPIKSTLYCSYEPELFADYMRALVEMSHRMDVDFEIGERLADVLYDAGFSSVETHTIHQEISLEEGQQLCELALMEMTPRLLSTGSATQEQIELWAKVIRDMPVADSKHIFRIAKQVYATAR